MAEEDSCRSQFTYRDLRLLSQSSTTSPLRVIALVDFDCFYAQCESVRLGLPDSQPLGVQQFQHVIAINYPARAAGLKKVVTTVEARQKCPNIVLQHVPTWREGDTTWAYRSDAIQHMATDKSSLDYYRLQSRRALEVVKKTLSCGPNAKVEKASIDEIFVDLSTQVHSILLARYSELLTEPGESLDSRLPMPWTDVLDWHDARLTSSNSEADQPETFDWDDIALHVGSEIAQNLRDQIYKQLRYTCSAGIAHNKVIAKLAAGHNKPNQQTVVRSRSVPSFLSNYKITKLRGLGGKLGQRVTKVFDTDQISELLDVPPGKMQSRLGAEAGNWVHRVVRGIDFSEVTPRTQIQSMLSAKTFTPSITGLEQAERWLRIFAADIIGRMDDLKEENSESERRPRTLAVHHQLNGRFGPTRSKQTSIPLGPRIDGPYLYKLSRNLLVEIARDGSTWPCVTLSVSVGDFSEAEAANHSISAYFAPQGQVMPSNADVEILSQSNSAQQTSSMSKKRTISDFQGFTRFPASKEDTSTERGAEITFKRQCIAPSSKAVVGNDEGDSDSSITSRGEGKYSCPRCTAQIPAEDVLEHLDWHTAVDLQNEHG
jgi:DNA polymerase eta